MLTFDSSPIALFDSGVGGLTLLKALQKQFPQESYIYLADTEQLPYGTKSPETIIELSLRNLERLEAFTPKALIIACNTASAWAYKVLCKKASYPVFNVIEPAAMRAIKLSMNKKIGLIATPSTIQSNAYQNKLLQLDSSVEVHSVSPPSLVPLIESCSYTADDARKRIEQEISCLFDHEIDTLILGCTHYPLLSSIFQKCYPNLNVVDSAYGLPTLLRQSEQIQFNQGERASTSKLLVTADFEMFLTKAQSLGVFFTTPSLII